MNGGLTLACEIGDADWVTFADSLGELLALVVGVALPLGLLETVVVGVLVGVWVGSSVGQSAG